MTPRSRHRIAALVMTALFGAGCPGALDDPDRFSGAACMLDIDVEQDIFVARCGSGNCHGAGPAPAANLDLTTLGVAARLIDVPGIGCGGRPLIQSDLPDNSAMIDRLLEEPECGLRMPLGGDALTTDELNCVRSWVFDATTGMTASSIGVEGG